MVNATSDVDAGSRLPAELATATDGTVAAVQSTVSPEQFVIVSAELIDPAGKIAGAGRPDEERRPGREHLVARTGDRGGRAVPERRELAAHTTTAVVGLALATTVRIAGGVVVNRGGVLSLVADLRDRDRLGRQFALGRTG